MFPFVRSRRCLLVMYSLLAGCATAASPTTATVVEPSALVTASRTRTLVPLTPPALFDELVERVARGDVPSRTVLADLPPALQDLTYDTYRSIRFRPERSLWRGEPGRFEVQFFHPGLYYNELVDVFVADQEVYPFPFSTQLFEYGSIARPASGAGLGFTGLRVHAPLEQTDYRDEVIVIQGASYFRSRGRNQVYGLSARALSIDMGSDKPEEFPRFNQLYLVRPGAEDNRMWILGTVVSARSKAVYALAVTPGDTTVIEVFAQVWTTAEVEALGFAPLTSMYLFGKEAPASFGDFRPEVHDSDGMAFLSASGEWLFRPLRNAPRNTRSVHRLDSPRGFGLLQRDRAFANYQDLEARYQDRPSAWIEPVGDWGAGALHLLELQSNLETNDNIALAWVPDQISDQGMRLHYRVHFGAGVDGIHGVTPPSGTVAATRIARTEAGVRFVLEFVGPGLSDLVDASDVQARIDVQGGRLVEQHVEPNRLGGSTRLSFEVACEVPARELELRAFAYAGDHVLSETWSYLWQACP